MTESGVRWMQGQRREACCNLVQTGHGTVQWGKMWNYLIRWINFDPAAAVTILTALVDVKG